MTFKDLLLSDIDEVFFEEDGFSDIVVYNFANGDPSKEISVIFDCGQDLAENVRGQAAFGVFVLKKADIEKPVFKDSILIDGDMYLVEGIIRGDKLCWQISARKEQRAKFG